MAVSFSRSNALGVNDVVYFIQGSGVHSLRSMGKNFLGWQKSAFAVKCRALAGLNWLHTLLEQKSLLPRPSKDDCKKTTMLLTVNPPSVGSSFSSSLSFTNTRSQRGKKSWRMLFSPVHFSRASYCVDTDTVTPESVRKKFNRDMYTRGYLGLANCGLRVFCNPKLCVYGFYPSKLEFW